MGYPGCKPVDNSESVTSTGDLESERMERGEVLRDLDGTRHRRTRSVRKGGDSRRWCVV